MKVPTLCCLAALTFSTAARAQQTEAPSGGGHGIKFMPEVVKPPVGKAITDEELKRRREAENFGGFVAEEARPKGWDLMDHSEFIAMNGFVTILPKGAILFVPETQKANILAKPVGRYVSWPEFAARYRGLVSLKEVSLDECSGKKQLEQKVLESAKKAGLILVAVYDGNPISVAKSAIPPLTEVTGK